MNGSSNEDRTDKLPSGRVRDDSAAQILRMLDELGREFSGLRGELSELRAEFIDFRDRVDSRLLKNTQPIGETLEASVPASRKSAPASRKSAQTSRTQNRQSAGSTAPSASFRAMF